MNELHNLANDLDDDDLGRFLESPAGRKYEVALQKAISSLEIALNDAIEAKDDAEEAEAESEEEDEDEDD